MGCTCGEPSEIKKNTHPEYVTTLYRDQAGNLKRNTKHMISLKPQDTGGMMMNPMAAHISSETSM